MMMMIMMTIMIIIMMTIMIIIITVGFETNIELNCEHKAMKYDLLINDLRPQYRTINVINLSVSSLGINEASSDAI